MTRNKNYFNKIIGNIKAFYSNALKGNDNLFFGIMTGCLDLSMRSLDLTMESLYSEINNVNECTLLNDVYFGDCYGFTKDDVNKILTHFKFTNITQVEDEIERLYDGYSCGSNVGIIKNIYNPYSIMKFIAINKDQKRKY